MDYHKQLLEYKENGYCIFDTHVTDEECEILNKVALNALFKLAFSKEPVKPEPNLENLKLWKSETERAILKDPNCIYINGNTRKPLCSKSGGGMCYGSYLKDVQKIFTMTGSTYDKISKLYRSKKIIQLFGPERYSIKMDGSQDINKKYLVTKYKNILRLFNIHCKMLNY